MNDPDSAASVNPMHAAPPPTCCDGETASGPRAAALHYARAHGMRVVPVSLEPIFRPLVAGWPVEATTNEDVINGWWRNWPTAWPAVATGKETGVWVLDIDVKNGTDGLASLAMLVNEHGPLDGTWTTRTPSGGWHYWFSHPMDVAIRNTVGMLPGIDVRGDGGLVVLPPAQRGGLAYTWATDPGTAELQAAPLGLLAEVTANAVDAPNLGAVRQLTFASALAAATYVDRVLTGECGVVAATSEGGRNSQLFRSSARIGQFVGGNALPEWVAERELERAALQCGLDLREANRTIRSGLRQGSLAPQAVTVAR